ncbi:hypothetical protein [Mesorhizobium sp.]|uniref:hypothetical protein n=1 Tax=Mesorhizobium sp. TaxID=1871066 RepID=UPI0034575D8E
MGEKRGTFPNSQNTAGSVFERPPTGPVGLIMEMAGLKGLRLEGLRLAPTRRLDNGSPDVSGADILDLITVMRDTAKRGFGVDFVTEQVAI